MKRFFSVLISIMLMASLCIPASAAYTTDVDFHLAVTSIPTDTNHVRKKDNSTSSYVNYQTMTDGSSARGVYRFEALIYGADSALSTEFTDCTSVIWGTNTKRPKAIVTRGTRGFIRQDVYERFGSNAWAELTARADSTSGTGYAFGCWSPDSVWENIGDYN